VVHIFDIDKTIIKRTSAWYFLRQALSDRVIRYSQIKNLPAEWVKYKLGRPDMDFIDKAVTQLAGIEEGVLKRTAETCFRHHIKPNIYTGAARLIREAQESGGEVIFATSSLRIIIQPLEFFFGVHNSLAGDLEFNGGITTGRLTGGSLFGIRKKTAVEEWLGRNSLCPKDAWFYSDSYTDIPLLEICGKPVAVNPDSTLAKAAKKHGWDIMRFTETGA
jgi:HAD superfamily hydrolase (TIGR01490 family)